MIRARIGAATVAVLIATAFAGTSAGVVNADDCGGPGPGILGPDNCGPPDNDTGGRRDSVYSSWPPGVYWGDSDGGDDNTPIVPVVP